VPLILKKLFQRRLPDGEYLLLKAPVLSLIPGGKTPLNRSPKRSKPRLWSAIFPAQNRRRIVRFGHAFSTE
jgi:hypothetical protein